MTFWTAHLADSRDPVLLREGFVWGAFLLGPLWFLSRGAWIPAGLSFAALLLASVLPSPASGFVSLGLMALLGLSAQDLRAWSLTRRGYHLAHIVTARTESDALARLLTNRPDLIERMARS